MSRLSPACARLAPLQRARPSGEAPLLSSLDGQLGAGGSSTTLYSLLQAEAAAEASARNGDARPRYGDWSARSTAPPPRIYSSVGAREVYQVATRQVL